ncbi:MAG: hypothetical protein M3Y77_10825 [Actinomycetota bacterium]|nr:hypothetical protein [Actinomycetota bacterium]
MRYLVVFGVLAPLLVVGCSGAPQSTRDHKSASAVSSTVTSLPEAGTEVAMIPGIVVRAKPSTPPARPTPPARSTSGVPSTSAAAQPATYSAGPESSGGDASSAGPSEESRFWIYTGNPALGQLRRAVDPSGQVYSWVYAGGTPGCTDVSVTYFFAGVQKGAYAPMVYIPAIDYLAANVEYNGAAVNQAANAGSWVSIPSVQTSANYGGGYSVTIDESTSRPVSNGKCVPSTTKISYSQIKIRRIG